jgi:hypothetical protein
MGVFLRNGAGAGMTGEWVPFRRRVEESGDDDVVRCAHGGGNVYPAAA